MKILLFSGGMDSTYLTWRLLSGGVMGVHLHHVSIRTSLESRWKKEVKAVENIIKYFKTKGFVFEYSNSVSELYDMDRVGFDSDTVLLYAQKLAQNFVNDKKIEILLGWNPHDMERADIAERAERNVTSNIWKALVESASNRKYIDKELKFPLIKWGVNKDTIFKELPQELIDLTWSCRYGDEKPCNKCHACKERERYK